MSYLSAISLNLANRDGGRYFSKVTSYLCTYHCHAPPTPGRARVGIIGDLQESFDRFPTPGDNFMLQIPYILYGDSKNNENLWTNAPTLGTNYAYKSLQIPTRCPTWGRWGLTMIGALLLITSHNVTRYSYVLL